MITVEEARGIVAGHVRDFGVEQVPLEQANGRVLREAIVADRDFPPYDRVTMDGIAIKFEDYEQGSRIFAVAGVAPAGAPRHAAPAQGQCLEVMTGAILPSGLDTIIPYEKVEIIDGKATLQTEELRRRMNIHQKGSDRPVGDIIVPPCRVISPAEIGVAATVGLGSISVSRLPRTLIVSSGDELVEVKIRPEEHQIRQSNVHQIRSALQQFGIVADRAHLTDDYDIIVQQMREFVRDYDLIVVSGGVSKGKFDWLPKALEEVGVEKLFHRVRQRPGKPFWFGAVQNKVTVFAFPGNPVSSFMCLHQYLMVWLHASLQLPVSPIVWATLTDNVDFAPDLTFFLQVRIDHLKNGLLAATPLRGNGSGDLASLVDGHAFLELPRGKDTFKKGETYAVRYYR